MSNGVKPIDDTGEVVQDAPSSSTVQSVERALDIIEALAKKAGPASLKEISESVGLSPSTTYRMLNTLVVRKFAEQDPDSSKYRLGIKVLELGGMALASMDLRGTVRPYLLSLSQQCKETVNLAVLDGRDVVYIDQIESSHLLVVKMFAKVGSRGPGHCTGSGKVLLSQFDERSLRRLYEGIKMERFTSETITDPDMLIKELERVRRQGYAVDMGERDEGVRCVAAGIRNQDGQIVAAISVSGPSLRLTNYYVTNELIPMVQQAALDASRAIGYRGA